VKDKRMNILLASTDLFGFCETLISIESGLPSLRVLFHG